MSDETEVTVSKEGIKVAGKHAAVFLATVTLVVSVLIGYVLWEHKAQAAAQSTALQTEIGQAIDKMTEAQLQSVQVQREMNCIILYRGTAGSQSAAERAELADFCKRLSR
jgi:hypothetical protein